MKLEFKDDFDFGFSLVDENELEVVQQAKAVITDTVSTADELKCKLDKLYSSILPLLNNLMASPEKEYLYWPDRASKVQAFKKKIDQIVE